MQSPERDRYATSSNQEESESSRTPAPENRKDGIPWQARAVCLAIGVAGMVVGLIRYHSGQHWFALHSGRTGWQVRPTLDLVIMGFMFVLLGLLPSGWFARRGDRKP